MTTNTPRRATRWVSVVRRTLATFVAAGAVATLTAPPASAASTQPGDFSSRVAPNPKTYWVDDCYVELGVVYDSVAYPNYRRIGGVRVNCNSRHSVVDATVALYYHNGSRWVQYGSSTHGARYNSTGSGAGLGGILRTPAYCVGGYRAYSWMVGATVRTERTGLTNYSYSFRDTVGGC
jgi:hypothetical protein